MSSHAIYSQISAELISRGAIDKSIVEQIAAPNDNSEIVGLLAPRVTSTLELAKVISQFRRLELFDPKKVPQDSNIFGSAAEGTIWLIYEQTCYVSNPFDTRVMNFIGKTRSTQFKRFGVLDASIKRDEIWKRIQIVDSESKSQDSLNLSIDDIVSLALRSALDLRASDIHFIPEEKRVVVKVRLDGKLRAVNEYPVSRAENVGRYLFHLCKVNFNPTGENVGSFTFAFDRQTVREIRASCVPQKIGNQKSVRIALRILGNEYGVTPLPNLGFEKNVLEDLQSISTRPQGLFIISGPTGAGKSSTLNSMLDYAVKNGPDKNYMTIEDPVEQTVFGVSHLEVDSNFNHEDAMRAVMRQDPDTIMTGEIRDRDTAEFCLQMALTGHMAFATIHANSAFAALTRLIELGVDLSVLLECVTGFSAQRLIRRVCKHCCSYAPFNSLEKFKLYSLDSFVQENANAEIPLPNASGCDNCYEGYSGRLPLFELLTLSNDVREMIKGKRSLHSIQRELMDMGAFTDLWRDGFRRVVDKETTLEEVESRCIDFLDYRKSEAKEDTRVIKLTPIAASPRHTIS